ncbi:hypothetical protein [Swingsia samuiensis]|uniref:NADH:quinone oxidoreductase/Mrp antiporter membrane subunit domain-containing protein n=1 Tax=Swingsia samuiensis TaxID=1293412 RepID=A0A4Y6UIW0_9PROT|nr:hypothetical protein [Swingsia samuiensis]QDH16406.1 hypothetical protein E3D00_01605 [Swingsia samuiensis]
MHPFAPIITLFAVTVWPLLAALLLLITPQSRQKASSLTFAIAGAIITFIAAWLLPRSDALAACCSCIVAAMPLLLPNVQQDRVGYILPFLVTGCVLMAMNVHSAFVIIVLCAAGTVLLAWREGRKAQQATLIWDMARLRLGGVIIAILGVSLLSVEQSPIGSVLLTVGLCMMAGLGPSSFPGVEATLLDTGLRFAALLLMLRLSSYVWVHFFILIAGFGTLMMTVWGPHQGRKAFLPILTALGAIAAGVGEGAALIVLLFVSFALAALDQRIKVTNYDMIAVGMAPWPIFCVLIAIGRSLNSFLLILMVMCLIPELKKIKSIRLFPAGPYKEFGWVPVIESLLLIVGLCGPLMLAWHPVSGWTP